MPSFKKPKSGSRYEALVAEVARRFAAGAEVKLNEMVCGKSGQVRQIDVSARSEIVGQPIFIVFECKHYGRPVDVGKIDELIGKIDDVSAQIGVLVSDSGFTKGALERAKSYGGIQLCSLLDSSAGWLKSRLTVPLSAVMVKLLPNFLVEFRVTNVSQESHDAASSYLSLSKSHAELIADYLQSHGLNLLEGFTNWCTINISGLTDGIYTYPANLEIDGLGVVAMTIKFERVSEAFTNPDVIVGATGLFDHSMKKLTVGEVDPWTFDEASIRSTWMPITPTPPLPTLHAFRRLQSYGPRTAELALTSLILQLRGCDT